VPCFSTRQDRISSTESIAVGGSPYRQTRQLAESKERNMREEHVGSETPSRENRVANGRQAARVLGNAANSVNEKKSFPLEVLCIKSQADFVIAA
jgi:hypothetical protein